MRTEYQVLSRNDSRKLAEYLASNAQIILPMVDLIEQSKVAVDQLIESVGRATVETVLLISAANVAGEYHQGKTGGEILRHGSQQGVVSLENRKMHVSRPRLRKRGGGKGSEVSLPAYEAMTSEEGLVGSVLKTMMVGVSTRNYASILPEACEKVGVSRSSVSRHFVEASEEEFKRLLERRFDEIKILVIYIDGMVFADHNVIAAVGVDDAGYKHVLGLASGATENSTVVKGLLEDLVERGIKPGVKRLFVIDGSKALRSAINAVCGEANPVQRCRIHKKRNVVGYVPDHLHEMVTCQIEAAWKLDADGGTKRIKDLARMLESQYPAASASLLEGLDEMFTVNRLGLPATLRKCLVSTNIIESNNSGVRAKTRRVTNWESGDMVRRWVASGLLSHEKSFRRIDGYRDLWILKAALGWEVDRREQAA